MSRSFITPSAVVRDTLHELRVLFDHMVDLGCLEAEIHVEDGRKWYAIVERPP